MGITASDDLDWVKSLELNVDLLSAAERCPLFGPGDGIRDSSFCRTGLRLDDNLGRVDAVRGRNENGLDVLLVRDLVSSFIEAPDIDLYDILPLRNEETDLGVCIVFCRFSV